MTKQSTKVSEKFETQDEFERVLGLAESNASTEFEMEFIASMRINYDKFGMRMFLSEKQEQVLDRIAYGEGFSK